MKTKNFLLTAVLLMSGLLSVNGVFAETTGPTSSIQSADVNVNIVLKPIQTITVSPASKDVDIVYQNIRDYNEGVSVQMDDHLEVFSTGAFKVKVSTNGDFMNDSESIDSEHVIISATNGSNTEIPVESFTTATGLTSLGHYLIESKLGGRNLKFNVTYDNKAAGNNDAYIIANKAHGTDETVYTAKVTYTIEPS